VGRSAHGSHVASGISITGPSALTTGQDLWRRGQVQVLGQDGSVAAAKNSGFAVTDRGPPGPIQAVAALLAEHYSATVHLELRGATAVRMRRSGGAERSASAGSGTFQALHGCYSRRWS
jgi:hypothetical protein